jgi:hypothetical protein
MSSGCSVPVGGGLRDTSVASASAVPKGASCGSVTSRVRAKGRG